MLKDMFASVKSNDLKSFKSYLDSGDATSAIRSTPFSTTTA